MDADHPLRRALPLVLLAGLCFSTLDATAKYLVQDHALFLVVWARYVGQMLVVTPISWHRGGRDFWRTRHLKLQLFRSLCLVGATLCFFGGLRFLPLAEGTAISFMAPMFAVILAGPVLGEKPTRARWIAVITGFVGILILVRPTGAIFHPATLLLVMAALSNSMYQLLTRRLPGDSPHTTLFYSGLVGTIVLTFLVPFLGDAPKTVTMVEVMFMVLLGFLAGVGHWLFITGFLLAPASLLAPFTYIHIVWATIWGWIVFDHLPDHWSGVGMAIIVASGVGLVLHERRMAAIKA